MSDYDVIEQLRNRIASIESSSEPYVPKAGKRTGSRANRNAASQDLNSSDSAMSKIVALVNASDKSEHAIRERLAKAGYSESAIDESVERAKSYGFINDLRFADVLIRSRLNQGKGMPGIERELRSHDIDIYDVPGWPEDYQSSEDVEFDRALSYLEKKPPRSKNLRDSAYRKLVSKGYSSAVAASAARAWVERLGTE